MNRDFLTHECSEFKLAETFISEQKAAPSWSGSRTLRSFTLPLFGDMDKVSHN